MTNLQARMDVRTRPEFEEEIAKSNSKERFWGRKWYEEKILSKYPNSDLQELGCASNEVFEHVNKDPDFVLKIRTNTSYNIEAKVSPVPCVTIKERDIAHALNPRCRNNFYLLIANASEQNKEMPENRTEREGLRYWLVQPDKMQLFRRGRRVAFGNKLAYRLFYDEIDEMLA